MPDHKLNNTKVFHLEGSDFSGKTLTVKGQKMPGITVVFAWASYCGYCIKAVPAIAELAKKNNKISINANSITIAAVQGDSKDLQDLEASSSIQNIATIKGYPTILIFKNGEFKEIYNENRTADAIQSYLENNY